jgi:hypothetical protein
MKTPKTLTILECRLCGGSYYIGKQRLTLYPGDENELPDELSIIVRKVSRCTSCKQREDRTLGGKRKKFKR